MTATVRVVCRSSIAPGFLLAGIPADPADQDEAAETVLAELARRGEIGVVLLQEEIRDALPQDLRARLDRSAAPVVVPFPGPAWKAAISAEDRVIELLRRAIGYRVKLR